MKFSSPQEKQEDLKFAIEFASQSTDPTSASQMDFLEKVKKEKKIIFGVFENLFESER